MYLNANIYNVLGLFCQVGLEWCVEDCKVCRQARCGAERGSMFTASQQTLSHDKAVTFLVLLLDKM